MLTTKLPDPDKLRIDQYHDLKFSILLPMASKFVPIKNPSLRETPRSQLAPILPSPQTESLVDWLEKTGRMSTREIQQEDFLEEDADISELMEGGDDNYDEEENAIDDE